MGGINSILEMIKRAVWRSALRKLAGGEQWSDADLRVMASRPHRAIDLNRRLPPMRKGE